MGKPRKLKPLPCGNCITATEIRSGLVKSSRPPEEWEKHCKCSYSLQELKRPNKRTLRIGQQVTCQPKQAKATKTHQGIISRLFESGSVLVDLDDDDPVIVGPQWVHVPNQKPEAETVPAIARHFQQLASRHREEVAAS
jgi:hypothetical protein